MFTVVAFSESQAHDAALNLINAVADQHIRVETTRVTVPTLNQIIGEIACAGANGQEARLVSPSLRRKNPLYITPLEVALVPGDVPKTAYHPDAPIPLDVNESLECEIRGAVNAAQQVTVGVMLCDGPQSPVSGEIVTINAEITLALVAGAWAFSQITFPDALPVGDYDVVGARLIAANGVVFRFVPVGAAHRPGGVVAQDFNDADPWEQRFGRMGAWFTFNTVQPPGVEVLAAAAVASGTYQLYLDVMPR